VLLFITSRTLWNLGLNIEIYPPSQPKAVASAGFAEEYGSATDVLLRRAQHGEKAVGLYFLRGNER